MDEARLNRKIVKRGRDLFDAIADQRPSLFDPGSWSGRLLDWAMRDEAFKVRLLRFVDVFPALRSTASLNRHLQEYFGGDDAAMPPPLRTAARLAAKGGQVGGALLGKVVTQTIRSLGRQFIIGENAAEAIATLERLRREGYAFTVDILGEATVSEAEAEACTDNYLELLAALGKAADKWSALGGDGTADWGSAPRLNLSVKPSAFYSQAKPQDPAGSAAAIVARMRKVYEAVIAQGGFMCIDMESTRLKETTFAVYRELRRAYPDCPHLGLAVQAYLRETGDDLAALLAWARQEELPVSVRLVKGAYWDFETITAGLHGWPSKVWEQKAQTDDAFESHARLLLENHDICHFACGSHNLRSVAAVQVLAEELQVPAARYEFQVLYGMAEPVRKALLAATGRVRLYSPYGALVPGMAYLVRRLLENTANESFLRQSFVEAADRERLLADPAGQIADKPSAEPPDAAASEDAEPPPFANQPAVDFTRPAAREAFTRALATVRSRLGAEVPLYIGGQDVVTEQKADSANPAADGEVVGRVCQAAPAEAEAAVAAATAALAGWRQTPFTERAALLRRAAAAARGRIFELAAWQVLEVGKQWDQAYADVTEAIDFLEFYAREMLRLGPPRRLGNLAGEENRYAYRSKGVAVVIAPWNFPLAISCGMVGAALVAGNPVIYKPSGLSAVIGRRLLELFLEAGVPSGVLNYLPGPGSVVGDVLVDHPQVALIAFTGSLETGRRIVERAARSAPGQAQVKKVVAEMGGKNAIVIDDDADLDEAVPQILASAFGYQGQKCSACSRLIVLEAVYDELMARLVPAAAALHLGPAEDPANSVGPVVDAAARDKIATYLELARRDGEVLVGGAPPDGNLVTPTIVAGIDPDHRLAQEEIFGPLLTVFRVADFEAALALANDTPFALTGGVFSRSPRNLERARTSFAVGNLYLNRGITGALVGRQPFGGFGLSGVGSKAGGPDYLLQFMDPVTVTDNTLRRGFAPPPGRD